MTNFDGCQLDPSTQNIILEVIQCMFLTACVLFVLSFSYHYFQFKNLLKESCWKNPVNFENFMINYHHCESHYDQSRSFIFFQISISFTRVDIAQLHEIGGLVDDKE